ncbi:phytoene desaturase family protein [Microbacterium sp. C7(2022)]|uniref:phytoene desaturase family protein n=1 Tax=Microbacterium sp. C7(2022) TaxID=2992759 RepID=UPI00237BD496|nr:phytoene desaturase family protein [Microbacterium sp. C7(2022)]MDE0545678.1 phytoene desaturase family protein [Microbacterium sp. C7(2022)]
MTEAARPLPRTAIVIGGGIAGLATATLLAHEGVQVTLFEGQDDVGGRAGSWERDGFRFDTGPSWYLMPEVFDHFFRLVGTSADDQLDLIDLDPAYRVYSDPETHREPVDVRSGRQAATTLFESIERGAGARLSAYLDSAEDAYGLAVQRFLYDTYESYAGLRDPEVLRRLPQLSLLLARPLAAKVEKDFTEPRLRQILEYPAVFLGGTPYGVPSLYHLMSHLDLSDGVRYPRGGFTEIIRAIERLAVAQGVDVRTGSPVARITTEGERATGVELEGGATFSADLVVSTADLHHTETALLPPRLRTYPDKWWDTKTPSPGALLVMLGVRGRIPQLSHHTLLFADQWEEGFTDIFGPSPRIPDPASLYVCAPSRTDPTVAPTDHENLFVLVPIPANPELGRGGIDGAGDEAIERAADRVITQISEWCGIPDLRERIVVRRTVAPGDFAADLNSWRGNALGLAHTLGQSAVFRPRNVSKKVSGLAYAGTSALPGIGLPMCLISAELVLKRLRGDRTPGPLAEPSRVQ